MGSKQAEPGAGSEVQSPYAPWSHSHLWGVPTKLWTQVCPSLLSPSPCKPVWTLTGAGAGCYSHLPLTEGPGRGNQSSVSHLGRTPVSVSCTGWKPRGFLGACLPLASQPCTAGSTSHRGHQACPWRPSISPHSSPTHAPGPCLPHGGPTARAHPPFLPFGPPDCSREGGLPQPRGLSTSCVSCPLA